MKIVKILGGLGNQMFQYALYLALKEKFPDEEIKIDISCFRGYPLHNGFELDDIFSLDYQTATWKDILKVAYPYPNYRCWQIGKYIMPKRKTMCIERADLFFDVSLLQQRGDKYYDGYWQHEEYFNFARDSIMSAFAFSEVENGRNQDIINKVSLQNSVAIHIRRGDYVKHPLFKGICDIGYYKSAIIYMKEHVDPDLYCVFSNDIEWCESNLSSLLPPDRTVYVSWNNGKQSYIDMQIMSRCKHNIVANSSFSWWGAWLNQNANKVVLAPHKWSNANIQDPVPNSWIRI